MIVDPLGLLLRIHARKKINVGELVNLTAAQRAKGIEVAFHRRPNLLINSAVSRARPMYRLLAISESAKGE